MNDKHGQPVLPGDLRIVNPNAAIEFQVMFFVIALDPQDHGRAFCHIIRGRDGLVWEWRAVNDMWLTEILGE